MNLVMCQADSVMKYETTDYAVAATTERLLSYSDDACTLQSAAMANVTPADFWPRKQITRNYRDAVDVAK